MINKNTKELVAKEGCYITQVNLEDEHNRIFVKKLSGNHIIDSEWKLDATEEDKEKWENKFAPNNKFDLITE